MTIFGDYRRGLSVIFDRISGIGTTPASSTEWTDFSDPTTIDYVSQAKLTFKFTSFAGIGVDELRMTYDADLEPAGDTYTPPAGGFDPLVCGQRSLTVSVRVECYDQSPDATALPYAENVRAGLRLPSVLESLQVLGLAIARIGPVRDLSHTGKDDRSVSVAQFDLFLNASSNIHDATVTTIETVIQDEPEIS